MGEEKRRVLNGLNAKEYEHELDRKALNALEGTPGLEILVRKFNEYALERLFKAQYTGSHIKVTPRNFPSVYELFAEICKVLDMPYTPDLYIKWDYNINACTMGVKKPIVVLHSGCIDLMTENELVFIMGHELGHIKSLHVLYHQMAIVFPILGQIIGKATLGVGEILSAGLQLALLYWSRMSEFTADRAGLLACQDADAAVSAFIKMAGVPQKYYNALVVDDFINQAREFEGFDYNALDKIAKILVIMDKTHPWTVMRAAELLKWIDGPAYNEIINRLPVIKANNDNAAPLFCGNCGSKLNPEDRFCSACGAKIDN